MRAQQTEIEEKISNTMENLIIEKMAERPEYVRTYLSNDMATIYVRNQLSVKNHKRKTAEIITKPLIKKQLQKVLHHDVLEIFPIVDPNGIFILIAIFCNQN